MTFGGIEISALALELGRTSRAVPLSHHAQPIFVRDRGALKRELDRAREIAFSVGHSPPRYPSTWASPRGRPSCRNVRSESSSSGQAAAVSPIVTMCPATR